MIREMRRMKQKLSEEECVLVLDRNTSGVLSVMGDDEYPYGVPMSYVYTEGKILFHCATTGHKLDAIANHDKVSFCIIDKDRIVPEKYTTYYRSIIAFGKARVVTQEDEILPLLEILAKKYSPLQKEEIKKEIDKQKSRVTIIEMEIQHLTGKEAMEF